MAGALLAADRYQRLVPGLPHDVLGQRMAEAEWESIPVRPDRGLPPAFDLMHFLGHMIRGEADATLHGEAVVLLAVRQSTHPTTWFAGLAVSLLVYSELYVPTETSTDPILARYAPAQFAASPVFDALVEHAVALDDRVLYDRLQLWAEGRRFTVVVSGESGRGGTVA
jgi:hypothetical protein